MNNANENLISNVLLICLAIMIALLIILCIVYLVIKIKQRPKKAKQKVNRNTETKQPQISNTTYNKQSIFDFMEFDDIQDNMIIQKNGKRFLMVVECQGVNYDLMSGMEKVAVEEGFQQFLNTLRHPIQIYVQTRTVNLERSISTYKDKVKEIEDKFNNMQFRYNQMKEAEVYSKEQLDRYFYDVTKQRNLLEYGRDLVYNTEKMSLNKNVLNKKYYIIIPYYPEEANDDKYSKEEIKNMAFNELYTKAQAIIRTLSACSVGGSILSSNELVELLYVSYNRDESEVFNLEKAIRAGANEMYSTSMDVFEKKIKVLDQEIENRAIDLANDTIAKVKSDLQQQAEEKEDNIDELVEAMSKIILQENKEYVGEEIANKAIEQIEKGGMQDVRQEKKTTRGRKKKSE